MSAYLKSLTTDQLYIASLMNGFHLANAPEHTEHHSKPMHFASADFIWGNVAALPAHAIKLRKGHSMTKEMQHEVSKRDALRRQKAFDLALRLAIKEEREAARGNAMKFAEAMASKLTPEQVQVALEKYDVKEM